MPPGAPPGGYGESTYGGYNAGGFDPGYYDQNTGIYYHDGGYTQDGQWHPNVPPPNGYTYDPSTGRTEFMAGQPGGQSAGGVSFGSPYQPTQYQSPFTHPDYGGQSGGGGGGIVGDIWSGAGGVLTWLYEELGEPLIDLLIGSGDGEGYLGDILGGAGMAALALMTMDASGKAGANREELLKQAMGTSTKEIAQGDKSTKMGNISTSQGLEAMLNAVSQGPQMFAPPNLRDMNNPYAGNYGSATPPPFSPGESPGWLGQMIGAMGPPTGGAPGGGAPTPPLQGPIIPQPNVPQPSGSGDPWPTPIPIQPNDPRRQPMPTPPPIPMGLPSSIPMGGQPPGMPQPAPVPFSPTPMPMPPPPTEPAGETGGLSDFFRRVMGG